MISALHFLPFQRWKYVHQNLALQTLESITNGSFQQTLEKLHYAYCEEFLWENKGTLRLNSRDFISSVYSRVNFRLRKFVCMSRRLFISGF